MQYPRVHDRLPQSRSTVDWEEALALDSPRGWSARLQVNERGLRVASRERTLQDRSGTSANSVAVMRQRFNRELYKLLGRVREELEAVRRSLNSPPGVVVTLGEVEIEDEIYRLSRVVRSQPIVAVTAREKEIAEMAGRGLPDKIIALELGISVHTVATHLRRVYTKLGVGSRISLAHHSFFAS